MVGHFVRLKLRLLANRLRTQSVLGTIGFIAIWLVAVVVGIFGGLAVFGLGRLTEEPGLILVISYTLVFVGWLVIPASFSALDESLDPRRFELLPLTPRHLIVGLLAAAAVTPGGVGTAIALFLATLASFPQWSLLPIIVPAVLVELLLCLVVARLVTSVLSNMLASRRTREILTLVFGLGVALIVLVPMLLDDSTGTDGPQIEIELTSLDGLGYLSLLPPGALARSVSLAADGDPLAGIGLIVYGVAATIVIGWAWARAVRRLLVTAPVSGRPGRRQGRVDRTLALVPSWIRIPSGPVMGLVAKEFRYFVRDNRVRAQLLGGAVPLVIVVFVAGDPLGAGPYTPFLAVGAAFLIIFSVLANQFGVDGGSLWGYVVAPSPLADVVRGKNVAWGLVIFPPLLAVAVGLAAWGGQYTYLPAAILAVMAVLLVAMAIGNVTSIYGAFRIPESNPFGNRGFSGGVFVTVVLSMMASGALLVPLALMIALPAVFLGPVVATAGALLGVGYGVVVYHLVMKLTSRLLIERQQLLLDTIDRELD